MNTPPTTTLAELDGDARIGQPIDLADDVMAVIEQRARAGMLIVDSTVTGELLDLVIFSGCAHEPPETLRDLLQAACQSAIVDELANLHDRIAAAVAAKVTS